MPKKTYPLAPNELLALRDAFFDSLVGESDRGCVLVGAAFLDEGLEMLLRSRMLLERHEVKKAIDPLFVGLGPLKSFWAKTHLCRGLSLIERWEYEDLERIRDLRNLFAHSYENADFDDHRVIAITERLVAADKAVQNLPPSPVVKAETSTKPQDQKPVRKFKKERLRFTMSASYLASSIHFRAGHRTPEDKEK